MANVLNVQELHKSYGPRTLFDGVSFHDWHSVAGEHTECLQILGGDNVTIRNSTFKNCGTANNGLGATGDLFVGFIDGGMKRSFFESEFAKSLREEWTLPPKRAQENARLLPVIQ